MWILHFIPDDLLIYLVHAMLVTGAITTFLSFFVINRILRWWPAFSAYFHIVQIISLVVFLAGVYLEGSYNTEMAWRSKVAEAEAKVAKAEVASQEANDKLEKERKKKSKVRTEYITTVKERIVEKEKLIDAKCELDPAVPQILNDASKNIGKKK
jgi:hypothetical protein